MMRLTGREQLEHAIAQLEAQRAILGDGAVDLAVAALASPSPRLWSQTR
jgi:hypothetical protein